MSPKALRALGALFAALAAAWALHAAWEARASRPRFLYPEAARAESVTLAGPEGTVRLAKSEGAWRLEAPFAAPADAGAVASALSELAAARVAGPFSDDAEKLPLFALQDSSATRLTAKGSGAPGLDVLLGGPGADPSHSFYRLPGSSEVFEAGPLSRWRKSARPGLWADKTLAALEPARVTRLRVRSPKGVVTMERKDGVWQGKGGEKLGPLLEALTRFEADEVLEAATLEAEPRARLDRAEFEVLVETFDYAGVPGQVAASFTVSPQGQDYRHLARVKGRETVVYSLSAWRLDPLRLDPKDFK